MSPIRLDEIDAKILDQLQKNARIPNVELAKCIGLSAAPCLRRVRALEDAGVIRGYVTLLDPSAVDLGVTIFVQVWLNAQASEPMNIFEEAIVKRREVMDCYLMTGDPDYLLRVVVPDVASYERFLRESLTKIASVNTIRSTFTLKQVKYSTALPLASDRLRGASHTSPSRLAQR